MRDFERLVDLYDRRVIGRGELLAGLVMIGVRGSPAATAQSPFQGRTLNHVSLGVSDLARSKDFYQRLLAVACSQFH